MIVSVRGVDACAATLRGLHCKREAGHPGLHYHGDEYTQQGATAWSDDGTVFSDHVKRTKAAPDPE